MMTEEQKPLELDSTYILDEHNNAIKCRDVLKWAQWFDAERHKHTLTTIVDEQKDMRVSTIFLGIDHAYGQGKPLLWETMIHDGKGNFWEDMQWRYTDYKEACEGHTHAVKEALVRINATRFTTKRM